MPEQTSGTVGGGSTVAVIGDLDFRTAHHWTEVLAASDGDVVVDLGSVEFVDSSGLRVLIGAHKRRVAAGARLILTNLSPPVQRLISLTGLDVYLVIE